MTSNYYILEHTMEVDINNYNEVKPLIYFDDMDLQASLWNAQSMKSFPLLTFLISDISFFPDYLNTWTNYILLSKRMTDILKELQVYFELHKVKLIDNKGNELDHPYSLFNLLEIQDAIDKERSIIDDKNIKIIKIVIKDSIIALAKPMFRFIDHPGFIAVHHNLVNTLKSNQITGCEYIPMDQFQVGTEFDMPCVDELIKRHNKLLK